MPYFLDGNNLIGRPGPSPMDRDALMAEIAGRLRRTRATAVLFFDGGARRALTLGPLRVRDGFGDSADEDILDAIARVRSPREVTVVTSDQALARKVRDAGATVLPPGEFWKRFGTSSAPPEKESGSIDVEDWIRYFADDRNRER